MPADLALADHQALDLDPVETLAVGAEQRCEMAVEAGGLDLDLRDRGDVSMVEIDDDLCRSRLTRRLPPTGLGDRQGAPRRSSRAVASPRFAPWLAANAE